MINSLTISNFAIVKDIFVEFNPGMTVITGETGAGKSIAIDAISLCLGVRGEAGMVRSGQDKAQVSISLTIDPLSLAHQWLIDHELLDEDEPTTVTLRRIVHIDGKSKAYINNHPVTLASLKSLSALLIHLYGQHAAQILLQPDSQLDILDRYINDFTLHKQVDSSYQKLQTLKKQLHKVQLQEEQIQQRRQFLILQLENFDNLNLAEHEFDEIFKEYTALSNLDEINHSCEQVLDLLNGNQHNVTFTLSKTQNIVERLQELDHDFSNSYQMISDALVSIEEAYAEIQSTANKYSQDPEYFQTVAARLQEIELVAKKLNLKPQNLYQEGQILRQELEQLEKSLDSSDELEQEIANTSAQLIQFCQQLHQLRNHNAKILSEKVTQIMQDLNMENAKFYVELEYDEQKINAKGADTIKLMLQANLGQKAGELNKVASGGELSRIALAIQVLTSNHLNNGTIIFDEVDVGISGKTAAIVGQMMQDIARSTQVICVTHLPQVASYGNNHYQVEKFVSEQQTTTKITLLDHEQRIHALAKLLGHQKINDQSLANAKNILELSHQSNK